MSYETFAEAIPTMTYEEQVNLLSVLVDAIKSHIPGKKSESIVKKTDCTDSYPKGYFDLFGSIDDPSFVEPEELSWELEAKKEFF